MMQFKPGYFRALSLCLCAFAAPGNAADQLPYQNPSLSVEARLADLLPRLMLEEKVAQLNLWPNLAELLKHKSIAAAETKTVLFQVTPDQLQFYNMKMKRVVEPGEFQVMVGTSSADNLKSKFEILK